MIAKKWKLGLFNGKADLTCQQKGGTVGTKLAPEGCKEVQELKALDATLGCQGAVGTRSHVVADGHEDKPEKLHALAAIVYIIDHVGCGPVADERDPRVEQRPEKIGEQRPIVARENGHK